MNAFIAFILMISMFTGVGGLATVPTDTTESESIITDAEYADIKYVNDAITGLLVAEEFKNSDFDTQVEMMEDLLKSLKADGYILSYSYSDCFPPMFEYEYSCGVGGGVFMKDFDDDVDGIFVEEEEDKKGFTDKELADMAAVDDAIDKLTLSKAYKGMSIFQQADAVGELLKKLESEGLIKNVSYSKSYPVMYSFEYACGVLGGVQIEPFDPMLN